MSTITTHTPTPWYAAQWTHHAASTVLINDASTLTGKRMVADCETEADAAFIVLACNAYAQLVEALRACSEADTGRKQVQAIDRARELLDVLAAAGAA